MLHTDTTQNTFSAAQNTASQQLEPPDELDNLVVKWQAEPESKQLNSALLKATEPVVTKAFKAYGVPYSPTLKLTAQAYVLDVMKRFDPTKNVKPQTFLLNELKRVNRMHYKQTNPIPIPEAVAYQYKDIKRIENELENTLGRSPTLDELSDKAGLSLKQLQRIKQYFMPSMIDDSASVNMDDTPDFSRQLWTEAVYHELDPIDQKIFEWTTGWQGTEVLPKQSIAQKLNISPAAVSKRSRRIFMKLREGEDYVGGF